MTLGSILSEGRVQSVVYSCNRIKQESRAIFQAKTKAKCVSIELGPRHFEQMQNLDHMSEEIVLEATGGNTDTTSIDSLLQD